MNSYLSALLSANYLVRGDVHRQRYQMSAVAGVDNSSALVKHLMHRQQHDIQQMTRLKQQVASINEDGCRAMPKPAPFTAHYEFALAVLELHLQQKHQLQSSNVGAGLQGMHTLLAEAKTVSTIPSPSLAQIAAANAVNKMIETKSELERLQRFARMSFFHQRQASSDASSQLLQQTIDDDVALALPLPPVKKPKGRTGTFPQKLHKILADLESQDKSDIASFMPHGQAFAIHKPIEFTEEVMPNYFRMSHFSSFQRQLNLYDFRRISDGPDKGGYYHEFFVREHVSASFMMRRNKVKGATKYSKSTYVSHDDDEDESCRQG
jgi:HSF-type DNA-binding